MQSSHCVECIYWLTYKCIHWLSVQMGEPQQQQFWVSAEVDKMSKAMKEVKEADIQVVPEEFLDKAKDGSTVAKLIKSLNLASWGGDVSCPSFTLAVPVYRRFFLNLKQNDC